MSSLPQPACPVPNATAEGSFLHRHLVAPLVDVLRVGCTPQRLAWSIAIGFVIGINPLLGSTTLVSLAVCALFRLNLVASQLATHLSYPVEVAIFFVFIRTGNRLFHTGRMPLHREALLSAARHHPIATTRLLWTWEWHALIVWLAASLVLAPLIATILIPIFTRIHARVQTAAPAA